MRGSSNSLKPVTLVKWHVQRLVAYSIGGLVVLMVAAYYGAELIRLERMDAQYAPQRFVDLDEPRVLPPLGPLARGEPAAALRVAVAPVISPEKSLASYRVFVGYLADKLHRTPVFTQWDNYGEVNEMMRNGQCDLALVCTYAFVRGERDFGMRALVIPQINGCVTYHSLIITPRSSTATSLLDLRGKSFASADILSNSGWLFPAIWLKQHGEDIRSFFAKHIISGSHDHSVLAVRNHYVDGAAVDSLVYDQMVAKDPSLATETRIILESPPFGMPPIVIPPNSDAKFTSALLRILLDMQTDENGRHILATLNIDKFVIPSETLFDSVRENVDLWETH